MFAAFKREVIQKEPEKFKIPLLLDVKSCFPRGHLPFFAGLGNRESVNQFYHSAFYYNSSKDI